MNVKLNVLVIIVVGFGLFENSIGELKVAGRNLLFEYRKELRECLKLPSTKSIMSCFRNCTTTLIDNTLQSDAIQICKGVRLMRLHPATQTPQMRSSVNDARDTISSTLSSHILQINITELAGELLQTDLENGVFEVTVPNEPRHRRYRNNMMMAMMFGITGLGAVLVPIGFQLLSVVSGKALLLAKMALLLASINGLKRIASSGVHYGLYQVPEHSNYGYYERGDVSQPFGGI